MFLVLVQRGKCEDADIVSVRTFNTKAEAENFCSSVQREGKYWTYAQIVDDGELIELGNPWLED